MLSPPSSPLPSPAASPGTRLARAPRGPERVLVGRLGTLADVANVLGRERGFFSDQGLEVELVDVESPEQLTTWLAGGRLDAGVALLSAPLLEAAARGVQLRIAAEAAGSPRGRGYFGLSARQPLADGLEQPSDLRGLRIGLPGRGTPAEVELAAYLRRGGLSLADVTLAFLSPERAADALAGGTLDLAMLPEPWPSQVEWLGVGRTLLHSDRLIPNHTAAVLVLSPRLVRTAPDIARRYLTGYLRAARVYNDAYVRDRADERDRVDDLLVQTALVPERDVLSRLTPPGLNPNGMIDIRGMRLDQDYYLRSGHQQRPADLAQLLDPSYAGFAITRLGEYR